MSSVTPLRRTDPVLLLSIFGFLVLGLLTIAVASYLLFAVGTVAAAVAFVMALVPLALVLFTLRWIDQWEPEPRPALLFAFLWGAAASIAIALIFSFLVSMAQAMSGVNESFATMFLAAVVQAPIVEEFGKGLGILLLFWAFRRHFEGPVDGLVYASTIAVGFAFTENIQYFGLALTSDGVAGVSEIFFLRGILSPFAHVMFTAIPGIVLGFASHRASGFGAAGYFLLGLIPAILLHAFWNGMSLIVTDFYVYYVVVQVPLFLIAISIVLFLRRQEQRVTAARLGEYAAVGWFTPAEVRMLSTGAGRSQGRAWAARHGLGPQFGRFTRNATRLAFARQRVVSSRDRIGAQRAESDLLAELMADRRALSALPPLPAPMPR
ncbi:MAG: PrsW family intrarane metalloprotease [Microbacteriaceae bacterium]|jgi:RsiW-degrading membrane proteinase PrsW (M82 family)|nr:PrsW family intrarane metalloprotease [Microbacteriaceae bacterium]